MRLPQSLTNAAAKAADGGNITYIAVWEDIAKELEGVRPLINAAPGVCAVAVEDEHTILIRPFIWTENLTPEVADLANAIHALGVTDGLIEAAEALSTPVTSFDSEVF
jgi:hypothetical protein